MVVHLEGQFFEDVLGDQAPPGGILERLAFGPEGVDAGR